MTIDLDTRTVNSLWSSVLVETLVRTGVRRAVVSPGSRSTPLTLALARHGGIQSVPVLDERSAAFFALGLAKVDLQPVVLVCTSGTAAANFFPAIIEANESGVPLIVITADRPPELRACASGQTIDQQKIYGGYVKFYHELAVPELRESRLRYLRQTIAHAVTRATMTSPGPVHLNAPFRDPLPPLPDGGEAERFAASVDWPHFFDGLAQPAATMTVATPPPLAPDVHGVIVAGPTQPANVSAWVDSVAKLATRLGWPVLADGLSPARNHGTRIPHLVTAYDSILRNPAAAERLKPDVVLCIGGWPTSKVLRGWLEAADAPMWLISERPDNRDALHGRTRTLGVSLAVLAEAVMAASAESGYQVMWSRYEQKIVAALDQRLDGTTEMVEPKAAWLLARHLPAGTSLVVANSMPVRDVEYFWRTGDRGIRPFCNRGANGIDGTLSTALGVAEAAGGPAALLSGDLALLHDTNGFLLRRHLHGSLTIVLINNRGGGIFEHLPVAQFDPPFEEFFATPQDVEFKALGATYGVEHIAVKDWPQFVSLVSNLPAKGLRVLEIRTDRKHDAALRKQWFAEAAAVLG